MSDSKGKACTICAKHGEAEVIEAELLVLTGVEAMFRQDTAQLDALYGLLGPFEAHVAISLLSFILDDACHHLGGSPMEYLRSTRESIYARQTELAATTRPTDRNGTDRDNGSK